MVSPSDSNIFARFTSSGLNRSRTGPRYNFRPPDGDVTWLSQLLECANQCGFKLSWSHECTQHSGLDLHTLTPLSKFIQRWLNCLIPYITSMTDTSQFCTIHSLLCVCQKDE